jgi:hypothetical protein
MFYLNKSPTLKTEVEVDPDYFSYSNSFWYTKHFGAWKYHYKEVRMLIVWRIIT